MDHGPVGPVAYSTTVPAPQPVAEIVPVVAGQVLFVMDSVGAPGLVQVPGAVVTPLDSGPTELASLSHWQRVLTVCAGPSWS